MKIFSWNPRGINALTTKNLAEVERFVREQQPDMVFFPETKGSSKTSPKVEVTLKKCFETASGCAWSFHWSHNTVKNGMYGNAVAIRESIPVERIDYHLEENVREPEGRIVSVHLRNSLLTIIGMYVPNASSQLSRLQYKVDWLRKLESLTNFYRNNQRHVVLIGDMNVAPDERDLCNPKSNLKTPGYTPEERKAFKESILSNFVDVWREQNPIALKTEKHKGTYTFWSTRTRARETNAGWRLDLVLFDRQHYSEYNVISKIYPQYMGSDHCPISLEFNFVDA